MRYKIILVRVWLHLSKGGRIYKFLVACEKGEVKKKLRYLK
jgi:hypothetical protein